MKRTPMPRVSKKRKLVCVYSYQLNMFEVRAITNKGKVSKVFAPQVAFTDDVKRAFQLFTVPFSGFKAVPSINKDKFHSWNEYIEAVWAAAN